MENEMILSDRLKSCAWTPNFRQADQVTRGGESLSIEYGPAYWTASFRYDNLQPNQYADLMAWIGRRNGSIVPFSSYLPSKRRPRNIPGETNAGLAVSGYNATTGAFTINRAAMALGDMVSYTASDNSMFCGQIIQIISTTGGSATVRTLPFAKPPAASPAPKIFEAAARFRMITQSLRIEDRAERLYSISFEARQKEN